jgi:UDP-3-O-[3-hydroxymyristoyl] glucosamine N-acyltransferase
MTHKNFKLSEVASLTGTILVGNPDHMIDGVSSLEKAASNQASFLENPRYEQAMLASNAGVIFLNSQMAHPKDKNLLISENPSMAFQKLVDILFKERGALTGFEGVHSTAVIHATAKLGSNVKVGPHAVIDQNTIIGDNTFIGSGSFIGPETTIGQNCIIHPRVVIRERTKIGNRVILQPGAVIGSCGFGYITNRQGEHVKLDQLGIVEIEDDVEIGANTTIDRSRFEVTTIKKGSKIDNLVQIGHNVTVGTHNIIVAQAGIAGSTETGRHVVVGGQAAVAGHLKITDEVMLAGRSGVTKSLLKKGKYGGVPAQPLEEHNRNSVFLHHIEKYLKPIKQLTEDVRLLKEKAKKDLP